MKKHNGYTGWWKLFDDAKGVGVTRTFGLAEKVNYPEKCKNYKDALAAIETWETHVTEWEANTCSKFNNSMKLLVLRKMVPSELEKNICDQSNNLKHMMKQRIMSFSKLCYIEMIQSRKKKN